ncbi:MAG: prepilin-type N-terminal cleavage/methylation domain-containing protein [Pyrinomonadaceae bacterium]|nr:prepilin-type N-terminal cleavage/methylation domain-containing protein [Pyrinomonadaceae bacterium]
MQRSIKNRGHLQAGFSAPETLIVVLVISILVVIAIPNVSKTLDLRLLETYSSVVSNKMTETRTYAIKHNRTAWLRIDPANRTSQIQTTDTAGNTINLKAAELLPARIAIAETSPVEFRFDSMGRLTTGTETVTFQLTASGQTKSKAITVSPAGKILVGSMH